MSKRALLLTLQSFSTTGGIQKMTRTLGYSIQQLAEANDWRFDFWSLYDPQESLLPEYVAEKHFRGFNKDKISFVCEVLKTCPEVDFLILTHINLSFIGVSVKLFNPECKVYLIAHGIEVWRPLSYFQKTLLKRCDLVLSVSNFTQQQIQDLHGVPAHKLRVLNNALDPLMPLPDSLIKPRYLAERYQLNENHKVVFTLTRLASTEQYKGYEQVIKAVEKLAIPYPEVKYILSGKYDEFEKKRISQLIQEHQVQEHVLVTGFVSEQELTDHFLLADLFVLPSKKEGFGLVFIEALACGLPVICGNADGSVDAIKHGELGVSIDVNDVDSLTDMIAAHLAQPLDLASKQHLQSKCISYFNEAQYRKQLEDILYQ